jgi:hypothetical protein
VLYTAGVRQTAGRTRRQAHAPPECASVAREEVAHNRGDGEVRAELDRVDLEGGHLRALQGAGDRRGLGAGSHETRARTRARETYTWTQSTIRGGLASDCTSREQVRHAQTMEPCRQAVTTMNSTDRGNHSPVSAKMRMAYQRGA